MKNLTKLETNLINAKFYDCKKGYFGTSKDYIFIEATTEVNFNNYFSATKNKIVDSIELENEKQELISFNIYNKSIVKTTKENRDNVTEYIKADTFNEVKEFIIK